MRRLRRARSVKEGAMTMPRRTISACSALAFALCTLLPTMSAAQDTSASPNYGTVNLRSGFSPDPHVVEVQAGGRININEAVSSDCRGYVSNAPDLRLSYTSGSGVLPLLIAVQSDSDTTLLVNAPDGRWYCNDDTNGLDPLIRFNNPSSGRYEIWVGTYSNSGMTPARLLISELESSVTEPVSANRSYIDSSLSPTYGRISLSSGFTPDPRTVSVRAGGSLRAETASSGCAGYVASAPDVSVNYSAGSLPLIISSSSSSDTTLLINDPQGNWYCDDDSGDGTNPSIRFSKPLSGEYDIWIGVYGSDRTEDATLSISELYSE